MTCSKCGEGYRVVIRPDGYSSEKTVFLAYRPDHDETLVIQGTRYKITEMKMYEDFIWCRVKNLGADTY